MRHARFKTLGLVLVGALLLAGFRTERATVVGLHVEPTVTLRNTPHPELDLQDRAKGPVATPTFTLRATGYNSLAAQTDATPHITATGTRTRPGIVAVSRDLLGSSLPYGSLVRLTDLGTYPYGYSPGYYQDVLDRQGLFVVEDTMHARKRQQIDVWFEDYRSAVRWGVRQVGVEVVRYGYDGPLLDQADSDGWLTPQATYAEAVRDN
jgi:3D (Asp-Asp-Asp) domain-containing protein